MKNIYKTISRRLILSIMLLVSCVFFIGMSFGPEEAADKAPPPTVSETATQASEPTVSAPETEPPPDGDGWPAQMDPELLEKIEALRCAFDRPIIITSGVRCERRNAEVGGIENSWHLSGHAADLYCPGVPCDEVAAVARTLGLGVIEYPYQQFDHVEIWR